LEIEWENGKVASQMKARIPSRFRIVILTAAICVTCPFTAAQEFHGGVRGIV